MQYRQKNERNVQWLYYALVLELFCYGIGIDDRKLIPAAFLQPMIGVTLLLIVINLFAYYNTSNRK